MKLLPIYRTTHGNAYHADSLDLLCSMKSNSVDLIITSPPFALNRKKKYGNHSASEYVEWFLQYAKEFKRVLKSRGSLVIEIGGAWNKGEATKSLYQFELLLDLCSAPLEFKLAQDFYWYNPAKLPAPAQWVNIERVRVKDAVTNIWWLCKKSNPKASNRRVLKPYSKSMESLLVNGYNHGKRPSEHTISTNWGKRNKGAIPPNLITAANTKSTDCYLDLCAASGMTPHPARFVEAIPEFFIKFLTRPGDLVLDPFGGSNVVGAVSERLDRKWIYCDSMLDYVLGSSFRFNGSIKV